MSIFFNVTLDQDIVLDDNVINANSGWSSQKIMDEIMAHVKDIIDNAISGDDITWSSNKILDEIEDHVAALIDDELKDPNTTWSSQKIMDTLTSGILSLIKDDATTSNNTWSSFRILSEIIKNRVAKFEELTDVDVVNRKNNQVVAYSESTGKFTTVDMSAIGDVAGISLKQLTKLGVTGTAATPQIVEIPISSLDFKLQKVNILKFMLGDQNVVKTEASFTNGESNDFNTDDMVVFDGTAHLKNSFNFAMVQGSDVGSYKHYSVNLNNIYKSITNLSVNTNADNSKALSINAIPTDRLLIPKGDLNLSNAANIDYFNVTAASGAKLICSVDSGVTWKTFNIDHWEDINLTVSDVIAKGMTVAAFNSISSLYWNMLVTTNKIRFAYLLQDTNSIDQLTLQYDCPGYWMEAKNADYDVVYASNSLLQVKLYISGDVKINY